MFKDLCDLMTEEFVLTLNVQEHALLMASNPAEGFTVKPTQVAETHTTDGQHRLAVTTADFEAPVLALKIKQTDIQLIFRHTSKRNVRNWLVFESARNDWGAETGLTIAILFIMTALLMKRSHPYK